MADSAKRPHLPSTEWLASAALSLYAGTIERRSAEAGFDAAAAMQSAVTDAREVWRLAAEAMEAEFETVGDKRPMTNAEPARFFRTGS